MQLSKLLKGGQFVITCELDSPKGVDIEDFLNEADLVKDYVSAVNIGDNRRAVMRAACLAICHLLKSKNIEPIMELSTRDKNRLALQSDLLGAAILGVENLVLVAGDPPYLGDHAEAKAVDDLDVAALASAVRALTEGRDIAGHSLDGAPDFCFGVMATPGLEPIEPHLEMLRQAIDQGAQFVQTQAVYEPGIMERFVEAIGRFKVPVIAGHIMLKSVGMASFMNSNFPGVTVPKELMDRLVGLPREQVVETSLQISVELLKKIKPMCQGIHLVPAGWERYVPRIVEALAR